MTEFGQIPNPGLYFGLVHEELEELCDATKFPVPEEVYKEAADLLYVVGGLFHSLGLDPDTLENSYRMVHSSNLTKLSESYETVQIWIDSNKLEATVVQSPSGKFYAKHNVTEKVLKGPMYMPVNFGTIFSNKQKINNDGSNG